MPITNKRAVAVTNPRGDRTVATNIGSELIIKLDAMCKERGITRSSFMRVLIERAVREENELALDDPSERT